MPEPGFAGGVLEPRLGLPGRRGFAIFRGSFAPLAQLDRASVYGTEG
jgi:hypothetical protein